MLVKAFLIVVYVSAQPLPMEARPFWAVDTVEECREDGATLLDQVREEMVKAGAEVGSAWFACVPVEGKEF